MKAHVCPECQGTGHSVFASPAYRCDLCEGRGVIWSHPGNLSFEQHDMVRLYQSDPSRRECQNPFHTTGGRGVCPDCRQCNFTGSGSEYASPSYVCKGEGVLGEQMVVDDHSPLRYGSPTLPDGSWVS